MALENCVAPTDRDQQLTVSGTIRVANVAFDKRVDVHWTTDPRTWSPEETFVETASYVPGTSDGGTLYYNRRKRRSLQ